MSAAGERPHVIVVGGGFAGLGCARKLAKHGDVRVTLLDRNNYHQFQPLLYQVATSQLGSSSIAMSLRKIFRKHPNVDVKLAEVASIDPATCTVTATDGETWAGDAVVLAAGSRPNFFGTPGADRNSFPLYSLNDAQRLRSRIIAVFEDADRDPSLLDRGALNFVVVGGGPDRRRDGRRARRHDRPDDDRRVPRPRGHDGARYTSSTSATRCWGRSRSARTTTSRRSCGARGSSFTWTPR